MTSYQLIIIGGGPGGYTAAIRAAQLGLRTALVEERELGGTCLNRGCIPTKALLHTAELYHAAAHDFSELGIQLSGLDYDGEKLYARKEQVVSQLREGVAQLMKANQIDVYAGHGQILGQGRVLVQAAEEQELSAENILIASGSVPARLPIPGADCPGVVTSDELLEGSGILKEGKLPQRLCIIGGGVIGCEFAGVFSALGCQVSIVEFMDRIVPTVDKDISQNLSMILKKRGVAVHTSSKVTKIEPSDEGLICCFEGKKGEEQVVSDLILLSTGRRANTAALLAEGVELEMERGLIRVDENFRSSMPGVYAIGDVIGGMQLAHKAEAEGQAAVAIIAGEKPEVRLDLIPACIYTDPEIACVGLTEAEAKEKGRAVKIGKFMMSANGKTQIAMGERGFIKLVFDAETEVLLGAALMCCRATDMLSELTTAISQGLNIHQLAAVVRPHPTFNEAVTEAVEAALGRSIHSAPKKAR
ncbi:MAG: dihydrolipoyl dehydrogenase [Bacillota bacterium]|nr:dihydrolipoyl dehydrogenase [Bacillota bacterium]